MLRTNSEALTASNDWRHVLCSPHNFLHSINIKAGVFEFVSTSRSRLSELSFLDGRVPLNESKQTIELPIDKVLNWYQTQTIRPNSQVNRFIFHMSFCGSTLLARTLDRPGRVLCYKEPQILLQLAELKSQESSLYRDRERWKPLIGFVLSQLRLQFNPGEASIIKPSNWLNSMLPELLFDGGDSKVVLLSISREAFLISIFRGGGERVQFMHSVLRHLNKAFPEYSSAASDAEASSQDSIELFARLALLTHAIQSKAFSRVAERMLTTEVFHCSYEELVNSPVEQLNSLSKVLQLGLHKDELASAISTNFAKHSKVNQRKFDITQSGQVNADVMKAYSDSFSKALIWADRNLQLASFH